MTGSVLEYSIWLKGLSLLGLIALAFWLAATLFPPSHPPPRETDTEDTAANSDAAREPPSA
jgi:hypothetical protein